MGKLHIKMGSLNLSTKSADISQEESKIADESSENTQFDRKAYQQSFFSQSTRYFKQALTHALALNKLSELKESLYLLTIVYSQLPFSGTVNYRRDIAA